MIGWEHFIYTFTCGAMLMMSGLGLYSAAVTPSLGLWEKRFFSIFFGALVIASSTFFLELATYFNPEVGILLEAAYIVQTFCATLPFPMLAVYLMRCCGEDYRRAPLVRAELALFAVYFVLLAISPFSTAFYDILPNSQIVRGPAYPLIIALLLAMLLLVLVGVVRRRDRLTRLRYRAFLICLIPMTVALLVHLFVDVFTLIDATLTVSAYAAYRIIVSDSIAQNLRQQREIESQRARIAVLQMRPHFIYNAMTSIYYLCDQDPQLAKQITMDFTTYLRKNFTAIASEDTIPFAEELEHTRAYLAVEQAQFEDNLIVDYETPHTLFRVPPLTLQPIVENAVKHGMDPDFGPLRISIRTVKAAFGIEIIVENDGSDFEPADDNEPGIALKNIRQRLEMMCNGSMAITPREGGGTVVKVTIPS